MKKFLSGFLVFVMVFSMFSFVPSSASAATTIFSDSFGANNLGTDSDDISWGSWSNGGNNGNNQDDAELRVSSNSGNDSASPDGGRHAVIFGKDGYICITIDTTGYENVKLSYNWRGDSDAENNDDGIVEYKANGESCSANANSFTQLQNHDLNIDNSWSTQSAFDLPEELDDNTFKLRFRVDSSSDDEHFRVDGILITGDAIVVKTNPTLSVSNSPVDYNGSAQSAVVVGSVAGVVSDIKYDGSSTAPTNAGTYAVTADFVPTDTINYNNLSDASAGNFVINPVLPPAFVKVTIAKFINGVQATAENTGGASFPMTASWSAENIGTGSGNFSLSSTGFNNPTPYQATTSDMTVGADYSVSENATTVCTPETPYVLAGYTTGNTLEDAMAGEKSLTAPEFTNLEGDKFVIVWNRTCVPLPVHTSPADESIKTTAEQTLIDWSDVINWALPISYVYQASNSMDTNPDGTFVSPVYTSVPLATSEIPTPGTPEGVYYWHVKAMDAGSNSSSWTTPWKITIDNTPEPMCSTDLSTTVVSNATTQVDEHNALLIEPHPAYVSITDASWIWSDASMLDDDEVMSAPIGTKVFTKTFSVTGTPLDSMLQVAADNTYTVMVNGNTLDTGTSGTDSDNFTAVDSWTVPASMLMSGSNTITFTVENQTKPEGYTGVNPAGLLYKLTVHQNECVTPEPPAPTYAKVHIFKYLKNIESISQVEDESGLPSFPMTASWNADIGEGTGDYVLGNNHGGATLKYSADTSSMLAPVASYSTYERTGVSEEGVANVLATDAQCVANTYRLVGYKTGGSLESAMLMEASTTAPSFTNFSADQYVIVVNEDCDDVIAQEQEEDDTGTLIIRKVVVNDQGGTKNATDFSFSVNGGEYVQFADNEDEDTMTAENVLVLKAGTYNVTESEVEDYINFSSEGCTDIVIVKDGSKTCTFINYDHPEMVPGSGSNGAGGGQNLPPAPQVLGASTENTTEGNTAPVGEVLGDTVCSTIYLNDFLFFRRKNNPEQVKLLQVFLNEYLNLNLAVDGFYGKATRDAVKAFQVKHSDEVLIPWRPFGLKDETGTGNVYKTTKRKINMIKCEDLNLPIPQLP